MSRFQVIVAGLLAAFIAIMGLTVMSPSGSAADAPPVPAPTEHTLGAFISDGGPRVE